MTKPNSGRLSIIPSAAVFDDRVGSADLRVLCAIAAHADRAGKCWPATTTLARELGVSDRRVRSCLRNLENCDYLKTAHRPGQRSTYWVCREASNPGTSASGVEGDPGTLPSGESGSSGSAPPEAQVPGTPEAHLPPNGVTNGTTNNYTFSGRIIRLSQRDFDTWAKAYSNIDLGAQLQALDDYYDRNLTGGDRNKWFARCSQALAKKNERARAGQQREEPKFNDGVY